MPTLDTIIDLSHHNDLAADALHRIKEAGFLAVILKATQGPDFTDPTYADRVKRVLLTGLLAGAYAFGEGKANGSGKTQADHLLKVASQPGGVPILDWEPNTQGPTMERITAEGFALRINDETGVWPLLYGSEAFLRAQLQHYAGPLQHCPLWIAAYRDQPPVSPPGFGALALWQYTQEGRAPGVSGNVDRSRFNGSEAALRALWRAHSIGGTK